MPPYYTQESLSAVERAAAWRWFDVPMAVLDVASQAWVLALIALALFAWLERRVVDVLKAFAPLALALAATAVFAIVARRIGALPRPAGGGRGVAPFLRHAFPTGQIGAVAAFAAYALLAYGRRARAALLLAVAAAVARAVSGPHWAIDLAGGGVAGGALGWLAWATSLRLWPGGHLACLRAERRRGVAGTPVAAPPSA